MSELACENCRYFRWGDEDREWGQCRRFPPQVFFAGRQHLELTQHESAWPTVGPRAWCGEFAPTLVKNPFAVERPRG